MHYTRLKRAGAGVAIAGLSASLLMASSVPAAVSDETEALGSYLAPYYTEGDLNADKQITEADLDILAAALGATSGTAEWEAVAAADYDEDGEITVADIAQLSQRMIYDDGPFELVEASAIDMQAAMNAGVVTSVDIVKEYEERIASYDKVTVDGGSRPLNSIISMNPNAEAIAAEMDAEREESGARSMLAGVPIILKDNYNTIDMPTTAGHGSWDANQTTDDAKMVEGLREAGAVILAKSSLDEFAYGFASEYTSFQDVGTSSLVASPYVTSRTAGGSSGGTGASIAANLGAIGFGTDTGGSIRVPSSYNQLVGIRPTVGVASRDGIVPLALSQDTGGPMARTVSDAAIALDAVVGTDENDAVTVNADANIPESYTQYLDPTALQGKKIGYYTSMIGSNATVVRLFNQAKADLEAQGATVVALTDSTATNTPLGNVLNEGSGSTNEFKHDLNEYISKYLAPEVQTRTLADIIASGKLVPGRTSIYTSRNNVTETTYQNWAGPTGTHTTQLATGKTLVTGIMDTNELDAIIYPSGSTYGTISTNLRLSPNTGMPAVTVPMGQASSVDGSNAIVGAGVNLEFLGRDYSEGSLLGLTYSYEQATKHRTSPALYPALGDE